MTSHASNNQAFGDFGLGSTRTLATRDVLIVCARTALVAAIGLQLTTQWLAHRLNYQVGLGDAAFYIGSWPIYAPWKALWWRWRLAGSPSALLLTQSANLALLTTFAVGALAAGITLVQRYRLLANRVDELHGSAHWATRSEIERAGLFKASGLVLGTWADTQARALRYLRSDGPEHVLMFAPSGSGKTVGPVLSSLLTWTHSLVVLDPKGENFELTSGWRSTFSRVVRVDLSDDPAQTSGFNPLRCVRIRTTKEVVDVQRLALSIMSPEGDGPQSEAGAYFINTGASLLSGAMLHTLYRDSAGGKTSCLADIERELNDPRRSLSQILREWVAYPHDPTFSQGWSDSEGPTQTNPLVASAASELLKLTPKERAPILSTVLSRLALFRDPLLAANTARSDFEIEDLVRGDKPVTLYLVLRFADQDRLRPVVRILVDLLVRRLTEETIFESPTAAAKHELAVRVSRACARLLGRSRNAATATITSPGSKQARRRLLFLLDEFPILGRMTSIESALAIARGWGIKFFLIVQDYEQLLAAYGKNETITSNTRIRLAYAPTKPETAKLVSALAGTTTVLQQNQSRSTTLGSVASARNSESEQGVRRDLIMPDETMRLRGPKLDRNNKIVEAGEMLVFVSGTSAIRATQALYFLDPTLLERAQMRRASSAPETKPAAPGSHTPTTETEAISPPVARPEANAPSAAGPELQLSPDLIAIGASGHDDSEESYEHVSDDQEIEEELDENDLIEDEVEDEVESPAGDNQASAIIPIRTTPKAPRSHAITPFGGPKAPKQAVHDSLQNASAIIHPESLGESVEHFPPTRHLEVDLLNADVAMAEACASPIAPTTLSRGDVAPVIQRLNDALRGHKIKLSQDVVAEHTDQGPRFLRAYVMLEPGESITSLRRCSEDLARAVGTTSADIHIANVPARHAVGLDLPVPGLSYSIAFDELAAHPSFEAAKRHLRLGFCAGIDVTGRPVWTDLSEMPHLLVAGTTGSGKTVFLRNILLTLLLARSPAQLQVRLSSSKPNDFRLFLQAPHAAEHGMAQDAEQAKTLALELVDEMERRYALLSEQYCDSVPDYNEAQPTKALPFIVAVFDEYAEMRSSFRVAADRTAFDTAIGRLAQKARAAGIHLILCMQRPDSKAVEGSIKANVLHRVALKLPQANDSRVILDTSGAETLLGQGDLFYKDAAGAMSRLQVPSLSSATLGNLIKQLAASAPPKPTGDDATPFYIDFESEEDEP